MRAMMSIGAVLGLLASSGFAWECTYPDTTDTRDYETIDLGVLLAGTGLEGAITDIVLEVESSIIELPQLRDENLINFIDALWAPDGNDIREVWNYFAALPPTERPR